MANTSDLCQILAAALGVKHAVVKEHARALREAGLFPGSDTDKSEPKHAAVLLLALMTGTPPDKLLDAVRLFAGLPLDCAYRGGTTNDGQWISGKIPADDPFMEMLRAWGDSFGVFLAVLIDWFNEASDTDFEVLNFTMGGGPGTACATIFYGALIEGENVTGSVKFSLAPFGGDVLPDDAARSRLERFCVIPGTILSTLRQFFTGNTDGPREVFTSRADFARLSGGGEA